MRPYFLQPHKITSYLSTTKQKWPKHITREVYLSFEDALWDLLPRLGYKKGSKFLLPSFYCVDVINNIQNHGYKTAIFEIKPDLTVDPARVAEAILQEKPDIFINFDPVGIPSGIPDWVFRKLPFHSLVVHDKVHTLIKSSIDNYPQSEKHLILNSFRKVSPFPGTVALYTRSARRSPNNVPFGYTAQALFLWFYYLTLLQFSTLFHLKFLATIATGVLKKHNDLIGDSMISAPLPAGILNIFDFIAIDYIEAKKVTHYDIYQKTLKTFILDHSRSVWTIPDSEMYSRTLRGYPLIMSTPVAQRFVKACHKVGYLVVLELNDSVWAEKQKIVYLPLGPHLKDKDIKRIAEIALKALTEAIQYDTITA